MESFFSVLLVMCLWSSGLCQILDESRMQAAIKILSDRFEGLKQSGLAVNELQNEYSNAEITYSTIGNNDINELLSSINYQDRVSNVLGVINNITTGTNSNTLSFENCCNITNFDTPQACCYGCNGTSNLIKRAAHSISSLNIEDVEFRIGFADSSILVYPGTVNDDCDILDARLMSWYNTATEQRDREIVIILDLNEKDISGKSSASDLRDAAFSIIESLTRNDKVGLVLVTTNKHRSCPDTLKRATDRTKAELIKLIDETIVTTNIDFVDIYESALNYFTTDPDTDRLFILLTDGRATYGVDLTDFMSAINDRLTTNEFGFNIYTANDVSGNSFLENLKQFTDTNEYLSLSDIASYYSTVDTNVTDYVFIATESNSNGVLSLSISKVWNDGDNFVGVVNALLPWKSIMSELTTVTNERPSSYYFLINQNGELLYHESLPSSVLVDVNPLFIEIDDVFNSVLNSINMTKNESFQFDKTFLVHQAAPFDESYIHRKIPSSYHCQLVINIPETMETSNGLIFVCLLLADEDASVVYGFTVTNIADLYRADPSRLPLYHTAISDLPSSDQCSYVCSLSSTDRFSLQLTTPNAPPTPSETEIIDYISGDGMAPDWIQGSIADEVAITSIAGTRWMKSQLRYQIESIPIARRHLATPSGVYLTYPSIELSTSFVPRYLSWYISAVNTPYKLSLSPAISDVLGVGVIYTASYAIRARNITGSNGGTVLSVLAADVNEESLKINVNTAIQDNLCDQSGYDCSIINDNGYFVLRPQSYSVATEEHITDIDEYAEIVKTLLVDGVMSKTGCNDVSSVDIDHRRYYTIAIGDGVTKCYESSGNCSTFCIQSINETNSFLLVVKRKESCTSNVFNFCFGPTCLQCDAFTSSVDCPCSCNQPICSDTNTLSLPLCPAGVVPPANYQINSTLNTLDIEFCNQKQCCEYNENACTSAPGCNWCSEEETCIPVATCCTNDVTCCNQFTSLPLCLRENCYLETNICPSSSPSPTVDITEPREIDYQAAIIGGVIGGIIAIVLLSSLVVCCVWYQVFRTPELTEGKDKSDFNFNDVRVSTINQTAVELQEKSSSPNTTKDDDNTKVNNINNV